MKTEKSDSDHLIGNTHLLNAEAQAGRIKLIWDFEYFIRNVKYSPALQGSSVFCPTR